MDLQNISHQARKQHTCSQCGRTIHEGEVYVKAQRPGTELSAPAKFHQACYQSLAKEQPSKSKKE